MGGSLLGKKMSFSTLLLNGLGIELGNTGIYIFKVHDKKPEEIGFCATGW